MEATWLDADTDDTIVGGFLLVPQPGGDGAGSAAAEFVIDGDMR